MEHSLYRCAGPACGRLKGDSERWWLMWTSRNELGISILSLCDWNPEIADKESALHVCGEGCAEKLQSVFMGNVRDHQAKPGRR
jgi:hypothetical protein